MREDAFGADGNQVVQTPNIDYLAASGTRFCHAYTAVPSCLPARAILMTGQHQWHTGVLVDLIDSPKYLAEIEIWRGYLVRELEERQCAQDQIRSPPCCFVTQPDHDAVVHIHRQVGAMLLDGAYGQKYHPSPLEGSPARFRPGHLFKKSFFGH
jgi:hypothetical protein